MKKNDWRYIIDTLLFICMFGIFFIGILLAFFLAEGPTVREQDKYFLNLHRHQWGDIHLILSLAFSILIVIHIILAWSWIKVNAKRIFKNNAGQILILTLVVSALVLVLSWVITPKYSSAYLDYGFGREGNLQAREYQNGDDNTVIIHGRMTLKDVENKTGLPAGALAERLKLPPKVSFDETLGQLRKKYGFTLVELRNIIDKLTPSTQKKIDSKEETYTNIAHQEGQNKAQTESSEHQTKSVYGRLEEEGAGIIITGQMSLREIEKRTGVQAERIIESLNLPKNTSFDEGLGRLRRKYGFTMQQLRDMISEMQEKM